MIRKQANQTRKAAGCSAENTAEGVGLALPKEAAALNADLAKLHKENGKPDAPIDTRTQSQKFEDAAREHGATDDEGAFKSVLRKLAKPKA